jgi:OOP family OmpA-OmpF porin
MKKILLVPALLLAGNLMASDYKYEVTPVIGYNIAEGNLGLDDYGVFGGELQYNGFDSAIAPELSIYYSDADYDGSSKDTDIWRAALNGVYEFDKIGPVIPLAKAGIGYEYMSDTYGTENTNSPFIDAGVGAKIPFTESMALKLEAIYMNKYNDSDFDNNLMITAGLNIAFGKQQEAPKEVDGDDDGDGVLNSSDKCPTTAVGVEVDSDGCKIDGDDDNDGVLNSIDECPTTPAGEKVDAKGCKIDGDDDNDGVPNSIDECPTTEAGVQVDAKGCMLDGDDDKDGVLNSMDKCPNTPANVESVNADGCMKEINLHVKFENASAVVDESYMDYINEAVNFLNEQPSYNVEIIGYTDSVGSTKNNKKLSQKRADAVKEVLVQKGIAEDRITATGMGEANPIADNATAEGRAQNRRIEAKFNKN